MVSMTRFGTRVLHNSYPTVEEGIAPAIPAPAIPGYDQQNQLLLPGYIKNTFPTIEQGIAPDVLGYDQ